MKKVLHHIALFILLPYIFLSGCEFTTTLEGSDRIVSLNIPKPPTQFTSLSLGTSIRATVIRSSYWAMDVTINDNLVEYFKIEQNGDNLALSLQGDFINFTNVQIDAVIFMPRIEEAEVSTGAELTFQNFTGLQDLYIDVSTSAKIDGYLSLSGTLYLNASTSARVDLRGQGESLELAGTTSAEIGLFSFPVNYADIKLSTSAEGRIQVSGTLELDISTSSLLKYKGNPAITSSYISTGGQLIHSY